LPIDQKMSGDVLLVDISSSELEGFVSFGTE